MGKLGYTWYPKDFISDFDVMTMTPAQRGIYRDLIDLAYMKGGVIPDNLTALSRYTNASPQEIAEVLEMKGEQVPEGWKIKGVSKRMDIAEKNRKNGKRGGRPRKNSPADNQEIKNPKTQIETQNITETEPKAKGKEKEKEKEKGKKKENTPPLTPAGGGVVKENDSPDFQKEIQWAHEFDQLAAAYGPTAYLSRARTPFIRARLAGAGFDEMIEGVKAYRHYCEAAGRKMRDLVTWVQDGGWNETADWRAKFEALPTGRPVKGGGASVPRVDPFNGNNSNDDKKLGDL